MFVWQQLPIMMPNFCVLLMLGTCVVVKLGEYQPAELPCAL